MGTLDRGLFRVTGRVGLAACALLVMLVAQVAHAQGDRPDRPSLATLLADANLAVPSEPFPAPAFSLPDLAGGTVDLERLRGRVVLLYFWATW